MKYFDPIFSLNNRLNSQLDTLKYFTQKCKRKILNSCLFVIAALLIFCNKINGQNTVYTPLYTSGNFIKTIDFTKPVGEIAGDASTTATGGVTYSIPIFTCPGTNGMQPSISLTYNSQTSSGIAGYGWSLSGLSVISRTGKNIYHNGSVGPVTYTPEDAFLLDGMRLNIISGTNGGDGIYAGEAESFAKIISFNSGFEGNPSWFQVITKDGSVMEFGHSSDARITAGTSQFVILWRLNKIIDINGNYINFIYDNTNGDSRISQILYTGNINTGLLPYNQISFAYSIRDDQNTVYEGGPSLSSKYLLDKITVIHTNDVNVNETVKTYKLNYGFDNINSMLKEIEEFGGDEASASLNSTIFLYGDQPQNITTSTTTFLQGTYDYYSGDFDADGKTDLLAAEKYFNTTFNTFLHTSYSLYKDIEESSAVLMYNKQLPQGRNVQVLGTKFLNFMTADYDGDGRDDVLNTKTSITYASGNTVIRRFDGIEINYTKSFNPSTGYTDYTPVDYPFPPNSNNEIHSSGKFFIPGDFDGNGNQDYIVITGDIVRQYPPPPPPYPTKLHTAYLTSPSTSQINSIISNFGIGANPYPLNYAETILNSDQINTIDFDGDGKNELFVTKDQTTYILSFKRISSDSYDCNFVTSTNLVTNTSKYFPGDFNGDKKTDILVRSSNGSWNILFSTGTDFIVVPFSFNQPVLMNGSYTDDKIVVADYNGDGKSDIVHGFPVWVNGTSNTSKFSLYYSKGLTSVASFYYEQYSYNNVLTFGDLITGDFNGDGRTDLINRISVNSPADFIAFKSFGQDRLLKKITTGHNVTTSFEYKLLTDKTTYPYFYDRTVSLDGPLNLNPFNYVELPIYALSGITLPDGIGGNNITEYSYEDAILHRAAKGFLGFKKITSKNNVSGITAVAESEINTQFAVPYVVRKTVSLTAINQQLSESLITNSFQNLSTGSSDIRYLQKIDKTLSIDYLNGKASESVNTYDNYGNIVNNVKKIGILAGNSISPTETVVSSSTFSLYNTPVPAKPDYITVTNTRAGMPAISATTTFSYTANGLQASETSFSGLAKAVTTTYAYNNLGNQITSTISSAGLNNRTVSSTYDPKGRYVITAQKTGSGLSQTESFTISSKWGLPLSHTSTDCLTTTNDYDAFGTLVNTVLPDGNNVTINNVWHTTNIFGSPNPDKLFYTYTHYTGGKPDSKIYINKFAQEWRQETASMYGTGARWHTISTTYDNRGNIKTKTNLHFPNVPIEDQDPPPPYTQPVETPRITTYNYDVYNRISSIVNDIGTVSYAYNQLSNGKMQTTITNPAGQSSSQIVDATGKVVNSIDNGGQLDFTYDSRGNQKEVNQSGSILISSVYDEYGRQVSLTDINAGTTVYSYDAYGQLKQQTDAKGNTHTMNYDDFGRIINRTGPEGTTSYEYYQHFSGCSNNKPTRITGFNGVIKEYTYDGLRRLASEIQTIDGTTYTTTYAYNSFSQLAQTTYPSGLSVFQTFDARGYLTKVYHSSTLPKNSLFANGWVDGEGKYLTYDLGFTKTTTKTYNKDFPATTSTPGVQNLTYNFEQTTGNLLQRTDNLKNQTEYFSFDNLNRLNTTIPNNTQQLGITYDATGANSMGNIVTKTDAGYYKYRNDKLHAIAYTMNQPVPGQSPVFPAPVSETPHTEQLITYTPFLKTASISENNYLLNLTYGPDYERVKTELFQYNNIEETRYFLGNYEKQVINGIIINTRDIHYISGGNGLCAILVKENGVINSYIVYTDHLGSITTVTDRGGTSIVAEQNFDAWGRRRDPNNWNIFYAANSNPATQSWLYRGFTGHETLPYFSLINMNGRIYDPILGRMLSPDNIVPASYNTQGYNRYAYALNNPLSFTDPDGNEPITFGVIGSAIVIGAMIGAFTGAVTYDMAGKSALGGFWRGAVVGGIGGLISGGLAGSFSSLGYVGSGIVQGAITGTATGGLNAILDGSNIWRSASGGAISGAILGGVNGVIKRLSIKPHASTHTGTSPNGDQFMSQDELETFIDNNVGSLGLIESTYRTDIKLATYTVLPDGYSLNAKGELISLSGGGRVAGTTTPVSNTGWFSPLHSKVIIAPYVKGIPMSNGGSFAQNTIVHELIHAYHNMLVSSGMSTLSAYKNFTESAASAYDLAYYKYYGIDANRFRIARSGIVSLGYPSNFGWRNLLKSGLINMGIK